MATMYFNMMFDYSDNYPEQFSTFFYAKSDQHL